MDACITKFMRMGPLEELKPLISTADIALTSLECVVSTKGSFFDKGEKRPFLYKARPEMLDTILVRLPTLSKGEYELYWGLQNSFNNSFATTIDTQIGKTTNYVKIGSVVVTRQ